MLLNPSQDCVKMGQTHKVVSSLSLVVCKAKLGEPMVVTLKGGPHESEKLEEVTLSSRAGSPVPRRRNWNPWGEVM